MNDGWIKLYRKTVDNEIFIHDPTAWHIFEYLILVADRKTGNRDIGRLQLSNILRIKSTTVYQALKRLKKCKMIDIKSNNKYSRIHICNFNNYQNGVDTSNDNRMTTNRQQDDNKMTLNKNKELRIKNNIKSDSNESNQINNIYETYLNAFNANENQYKLTDQRKTKIKARLKDAGDEMILKAIKNVSQSDFHRGNNDRNWKADLDFIIRSYEQVEKLSNLNNKEKVVEFTL